MTDVPRLNLRVAGKWHRPSCLFAPSAIDRSSRHPTNMFGTAPPSAWADVGQPPVAAAAAAAASGSLTTAAAASAYKHLRTVTTADARSSSDLYDLLSHSVRESQYSVQPPEVNLGRDSLKRGGLVQPWGSATAACRQPPAHPAFDIVRCGLQCCFALCLLLDRHRHGLSKAH